MLDPGGRGRGKVEEKAIVFWQFLAWRTGGLFNKDWAFSRNIQEKGLKLSKKGRNGLNHLKNCKIDPYSNVSFVRVCFPRNM